MSDPADEIFPGKISAKGREAEARIGQLSGQITLENIHDGSDRSLEYSLLAVEILDEYLSAMDFLLASPLMSADDRQTMQDHRADFAGRRVKAQRTVETNREKSSGGPGQK